MLGHSQQTLCYFLYFRKILEKTTVLQPSKAKNLSSHLPCLFRYLLSTNTHSHLKIIVLPKSYSITTINISKNQIDALFEVFAHTKRAFYARRIQLFLGTFALLC